VLKDISELGAALAWPSVVLFCVIYFRTQLRLVLQALERRFDSVSKISFGPLTLEIRALLQSSGDTELQEVLPKVSRPAFQVLLRISEKNTSHGFCYSSRRPPSNIEIVGMRFDEKFEALRELERLQLVRFTEPLWEWEAFFESLPSYTLERRGIAAEGFVRTDMLSEEQVNRVTGQHWALTDLGQRAYDAVLTVVVRQLASK
jgi:hypothetical protein